VTQNKTKTDDQKIV